MADIDFPEPGSAPDSARIRARIDSVYREESRRVLATLIRLLGDFDVAEDAMHEAFGAALEQWGRDGIPSNPRAWLVSAGRFKAIDAMRRRSKFDGSVTELADRVEADVPDPAEEIDKVVSDDQLRLIFTCCHPALSPEARTALTMREVCGLTTEEIARAFLSAPSTIAQRIVRAKSKIRDARIPYRVPSREELPERLETVLQVVYLVFNEGYSASSGDSLIRPDISGEAIRLGKVLKDLLPEPEVLGLLALMLLQESRREARVSADGELILLDDQDRSRWNRDLISQAIPLVEQSLRSRRFGPYTLQAAIAAVHADSRTPEETDWNQIVTLYDALLYIVPSPVIELNRAVAIAMRDGPETGLTIVDTILARGDLEQYHLAHSAKAEFCRRLGRLGDARSSYERALSLVQQGPEKRFLERRMKEMVG